MRTTIDLPDETFRALKSLAIERGTSFKEVLRRAAERELTLATTRCARRVEFPLVRSTRPASLDLTNAKIEDLLT